MVVKLVHSAVKELALDWKISKVGTVQAQQQYIPIGSKLLEALLVVLKRHERMATILAVRDIFTHPQSLPKWGCSVNFLKKEKASSLGWPYCDRGWFRMSRSPQVKMR